MVKKGNLYYSSDRCPNCGFRLPSLAFCRQVSLCVKCAREKLGEAVCKTCPDREECDKAIRGVEFIKKIEESTIMIIPDLASALQEYVQSVLTANKVENAESIAQELVKIFLATTSTLLIVRDVPTWLKTLLKPSAIKSILKLPLDLLPVQEHVVQAISEYALTLGVDAQFLLNYLKFLVVRYVILFKNRDISTFVEETFNDMVVEALLTHNWSSKTDQVSTH